MTITGISPEVGEKILPYLEARRRAGFFSVSSPQFDHFETRLHAEAVYPVDPPTLHLLATVHNVLSVDYQTAREHLSWSAEDFKFYQS